MPLSAQQRQNLVLLTIRLEPCIKRGVSSMEDWCALQTLRGILAWQRDLLVIPPSMQQIGQDLKTGAVGEVKSLLVEAAEWLGRVA